MANILATILPNAKPGIKRFDSDKVGLTGVAVLLLDADPTTSATVAPIGSFGVFDNAGTGELYFKTGSGDTAWFQVTTA